ncbi:hypothetical protein ACTJJB_32535 [Chitinophaga sp. 22536]|uniref:hypothetical protein n=1 Tax=unclassified Chitinophaga TaxID=2619133 RepID=UPI003F87A353
MKRLINQLNKAYNEYSDSDVCRLGKLNDMVLARLVKDIRQTPSEDNFIIFTSCINYFYSTRLQAAVNQDRRTLNTWGKVIIRIAKVLEAAWDDEEICLKKEKQGGKVDTKKVEHLRELLHDKIDRGTYSFTTKVFHQLNSQYPILDGRVNQFMEQIILKRKGHFHKRETPFSTFYSEYIQMMERLQWPVNQVNELDNAIWFYYSKHMAK